MPKETVDKKGILYRIGICIARRSKSVIVGSILLTLLAVAAGGSALDKFSLARFQASGSESVQAGDILGDSFGVGVPNLTIVVTAKDGTVDDPAVASAGMALTTELADEPAVTEVASYWTRNRSPVLRGDGGRQALIIARVAGNATEAREAIATIGPKFTQSTSAIKTHVGGRDEVFRQVGAQARQDFLRAEMIILPVMAILLYLVYRRLTPALLTLGMGIFSVFGTLALLAMLLPFTEISTFASNLTLVMGLALGLDYSLLMISRFREQQRAGQPKSEAIATTVATAGRTILFSGVTVGVSLSALLLFPFPFLQSFAYAGIGVVLTAIIGAVVVLPAALALLGGRIERRNPPDAGRTKHNVWHNIALLIMRRPIIYAIVALAAVSVLASPALRLQFGLPDDRILPETASSRQAQQQIRDHFTAEEADALQIVTEPIGSPQRAIREVTAYAQHLSEVPGVAQVDYVGGSFAGGNRIAAATTSSTARFSGTDRTWFSVIPESERLERDTAGLVSDVRSVPAPFQTLVGGATAEVTDFRQALLARMPLVLTVILAATFVLLLLMLRSLLVPTLATLLNSLSLAVMFGALVWIFQEGNLSGLLNFTATGFIEPSIPILMVCVAYGLSMDYQLFMLSRIKEAFDEAGNHRLAVLTGLQRTAPIILPAAAILAFTFGVYLTSSITQLKMLAVGMAVTVLIDATLIRVVLLPALLELAGKACWWFPLWTKGRPGMKRVKE